MFKLSVGKNRAVTAVTQVKRIRTVLITLQVNFELAAQLQRVKAKPL